MCDNVQYCSDDMTHIFLKYDHVEINGILWFLHPIIKSLVVNKNVMINEGLWILMKANEKKIEAFLF